MSHHSQTLVQPALRLLIGLLVAFILPGAFAKDTFKISGFVGNSSTEPASKVTVKLLDGESGKVLDIVQTGFTGKYTFDDLKPGYYVIQAGEVKREVMLKAKDLRMDIDLSAKDGAMRYAKAEDIASAISGAVAGSGATPSAGPAAGPNDPKLMQAIAGSYWGYEGSTETQMMLCPNGAFSDSSESSYSGRSSDQLGNETMRWGTASQSGSRGNWRVQGNAQQGTINLVYAGGTTSEVQYQAVDQGCYRFGGKTLCRKGPAQCP